jgi:DNA repair exonuclease SbcCD ATPase subunit
MDTLESRWNSIVCHAPIRLLRLQYERLENIVVKELKQAEDELNEELKQIENQLDTADILQRHNERFQLNNFHPTMETHIKNLHAFANDIRTKESSTSTNEENDQIDQRTTKLNDYWTRMQTKIDNVKRKLQTIPKQRQEFEEKYVVECGRHAPRPGTTPKSRARCMPRVWN